jgi:hypothetical protein
MVYFPHFGMFGPRKIWQTRPKWQDMVTLAAKKLRQKSGS